MEVKKTHEIGVHLPSRCYPLQSVLKLLLMRLSLSSVLPGNREAYSVQPERKRKEVDDSVGKSDQRPDAAQFSYALDESPAVGGWLLCSCVYGFFEHVVRYFLKSSIYGTSRTFPQLLKTELKLLKRCIKTRC